MTRAPENADEAAGNAIIGALDGSAGAVVSIAPDVTAAAFRSGIGDGVYDVWLGHAADGEVAMLLTDFGVLASEAYVAGVHAQWAARRRKRWWQFWK